MQPQNIYRSTTEITEIITQGTSLFLDNFPRRNPIRENRCNRYESFNTTRVPKMAYPSENFLGRSTSPWRQIFWLISHEMINPTTATTTPTNQHCRVCTSNTTNITPRGHQK